MNLTWTQIIIRTVVKRIKKRENSLEELSAYEIAKGYRELRISIRSFFNNSLFILVGIVLAAFGLKGFLLPSKFIDGGATGISLLISELTSIPLSVLIILINIPFLVLGLNIISRQFAMKAGLAILGLAVVLFFIDFPEVTKDRLLVSVFGGFFLGAGIGLSIRGGAVIDGTEVLAIYLSRKLGTTIGDIIIIINVLVFSAAAYFLSIETALYSMLTYLAASKTLDFVIEGIEEYTGVTIISVRSDEIRKMIIGNMGRGVTVYKGKRGFGVHGHTDEIDIIYTVVTRLEISKLNTEIQKIDPNSFVVMSSVKDTKGGMIKKRPLKH